MSLRFAILTTHPVQYQACWYRALAASPGLEFDVLFCHKSTARDQAAAGFGVEFEWDIPLLEGYSYRFLNNVAPKPSTSSWRGTDIPKVGEILRGSRYEALIVSGWFYRAAWQSIRAAWKSGISVLVRGDSHLHSPRSPIKLLLKDPLYKWAIPRFDACLAVGKWSRDYFQHYGASREKIFTVPHCVDEKIFSQSAENNEPFRQTWRNSFKLMQHQCVFLFAGKFISKKRPLDFVSALSLASKRGANAVGIMVGDGELRPACEKLARETAAPVCFTGFLNQSAIQHAYAGCDVLVLPSDGGETWGLVVNEAMSFGRPALVSSTVGAGVDLIDPGITGDIFDLGNVNQLANLIEDYSSNLAKTRSMGGAVAGKMAQYSVRAAVHGTRAALDYVATQRRKAA